MAAQKLVSGLTLPLTVYYDGTCKLCRSEFENIGARDVRRELVLIDCSPPDFDAGGLPVSRDVLMHVIHAHDSDGKWISGVDVFIAAYRAADLNWVSTILHHRLVQAVCHSRLSVAGAQSLPHRRAGFASHSQFLYASSIPPQESGGINGASERVQKRRLQRWCKW